MSEENKIIIPEEIKNFFRQNEIEIDGKFDLDNFDASHKTITDLFYWLWLRQRLSDWVSLKTMLEFSQNIVSTNSEYLDGEVVKSMFVVLRKSLRASKKNNQDIDQTIFLESLALVKNVVKLKIELSPTDEQLRMSSFMKNIIQNANFEFDINLVFDAINDICDSYVNNKQDLITSNLFCLLFFLRGLYKYGLNVQKSLPLIQKIWDKFNESSDCVVTTEMFGLLNYSLKYQNDKSVGKKDIETILKLIEDVLKSKIKLDKDTVTQIRKVTELLSETIAKDYFQEFDVQQVFIMLWSVCINTVDDFNDDNEAIREKVCLILCSLEIFIDTLNKYHGTENAYITELVKYVWSQAKNVLDNQNAPVRNQKIVQLMLGILTNMSRDEDILNFVNENFTDILSLVTKVLNLDFWLNSPLGWNTVENGWTVKAALNTLLELSQIGKEQSKQINNYIKALGLEIENDAIIIKDKNVFNRFYGDKSECINEIINEQKKYIESKNQRDNKEKENDEMNENKIENETEDHKIENENDQDNRIDQEDMNKTQPNDLKTEAKVEKKETESTKEKQKITDTKKVIKTSTQSEETSTKKTYTSEQILEEIENAYRQNRETDSNISPDELCGAIKSSERYYYYAAMLPSEKYNAIKKDLSPWMRFVIFLYWLIPFKLFTHPDKITINKQPISNGNTNKFSNEYLNTRGIKIEIKKNGHKQILQRNFKGSYCGKEKQTIVL